VGWSSTTTTERGEGPRPPAGRPARSGAVGGIPFEDVLAHGPALLAVVDREGTLIALSRAWANALGFEDPLDKPAHFTALVHPDDRGNVVAALAAAAGGTPSAGGEHRFCGAGGGMVRLAWRAAAGGDGDVLHVSATSVAERDAAHAELDALTASLAHDLRAPLRAVDGFAHLVAQHAPEMSDAARKAVSLVIQSSRELARLLDALVEVGRIGREELAPEAVDVADIARRVIAGRPAARPGDPEVAWTVRGVPPARADPGLVRRLVEALLDNAVRAGAAHVEVAFDDTAGAYVVRDDGEGFDDARAAQAFAIFGRLRAPREGDGPGIGLALAERIVGRHGGRIWARSRPGEGAAIWFTLPR